MIRRSTRKPRFRAEQTGFRTLYREMDDRFSKMTLAEIVEACPDDCAQCGAIIVPTLGLCDPQHNSFCNMRCMNAFQCAQSKLYLERRESDLGPLRSIVEDPKPKAAFKSVSL